MTLPNKLAVLLMLPIASIGIYVVGNNVEDVENNIVNASKNWLLIHLTVYFFNYILAWFARASWPVTMGRMLICGVFGFICLSELVDLIGHNYGNWAQLLGGEGVLSEISVKATRYAIISWISATVLMITSIGIGFESDNESNDSVD